MGSLIIISSLIITFCLFLISKILYPTVSSIWILITQISGLLGSILISINFLLATKNKYVEKLFKGLDKTYKIHNHIGQFGFIFVILHIIFLIINSLPFNNTAIYLIPSFSNLAYFFGITSFYLLLIIISLTIFIKLPYKFWKQTHEYIGLVIIFASIHSLLITSDVSRFLLLKIWILTFNLSALIAFIYKRYIYYFLIPKNNYKVIATKQDKDYLILDLTPIDIKKAINFKAGQFAFFSLKDNQRDDHPFSILEQQGENIKVGIKIFGGFTTNLAKLKIGDLISVNGPFGTFSEELKKAKNIVFISGGIGITPFLTMSKSLNKEQTVTLIHSCKSNDSKIFYDMFNINKFIHYSDKLGHLDINQINKYITLKENTSIFICGPTKMMVDLKNQFIKVGIDKNKIFFEDFELK